MDIDEGDATNESGVIDAKIPLIDENNEDDKIHDEYEASIVLGYDKKEIAEARKRIYNNSDDKPIIDNRSNTGDEHKLDNIANKLDKIDDYIVKKEKKKGDENDVA